METASLLLQSLGGTSNIQDIEPCMLRIRIEVKSPEKVDDMGLRLPEVLAVVRSGHVIQIVLGAGAGKIALQMLHLCQPDKILIVAESFTCVCRKVCLLAHKDRSRLLFSSP